VEMFARFKLSSLLYKSVDSDVSKFFNHVHSTQLNEVISKMLAIDSSSSGKSFTTKTLRINNILLMPVRLIQSIQKGNFC